MLIGYRRLETPAPILPPSIPALLENRSQGADRDRIALRLVDGHAEPIAQATYAELYRRSAYVARELAQTGVKSGQPVMLLLESSLEFYYGLFGAMLLGAIPVAVYPPLGRQNLPASLQHLRSVGEHLQPSAIVTSQLLYGVANQVRRAKSAVLVLKNVGEHSEVPPLALADPKERTVLLQYTSGSLGHPRAIALSTATIYANLLAIGDAFGMQSGDVGMSWLPLYHDMGLHSIFFNLIFTMPLVLMSPIDFLRRPSGWLRAIDRYQVTHSPAPNFGYSFAARRVRDADISDLNLSRWRVAMCGAEPIDARILAQFAERFAKHGFSASAFMAAYGLAENTVAVSFAPPQSGLRTGAMSVVSVGKPIAGHEVRIVASAGQELPDGQQGEIEVRGPSRMNEYFGDSEATRDAFHDDWLRTGDLGHAQAGELYITGRKKDLIIRAGKNYYPQDLEAAATVDGVRHGCVIAFGHIDAQQGTEEIVMVAEVKDEAQLGNAQLSDRIRAAVHDAVGVAVWRVVLVGKNVIPKTTSGKLQRLKCRQMFEKNELTASRGPSLGMLARVGAFTVLPAPVQRAIERLRRLLP